MGEVFSRNQEIYRTCNGTRETETVRTLRLVIYLALCRQTALSPLDGKPSKKLPTLKLLYCTSKGAKVDRQPTIYLLRLSAIGEYVYRTKQRHVVSEDTIRAPSERTNTIADIRYPCGTDDNRMNAYLADVGAVEEGFEWQGRAYRA